jgi:hypothetical protein
MINLYGDQTYMGLKYHMEEALKEKNYNLHNVTNSPKIAIFSKKYYDSINNLTILKNMIFVLLVL